MSVQTTFQVAVPDFNCAEVIFKVTWVHFDPPGGNFTDKVLEYCKKKAVHLQVLQGPIKKT